MKLYYSITGIGPAGQNGSRTITTRPADGGSTKLDDYMRNVPVEFAVDRNALRGVSVRVGDLLIRDDDGNIHFARVNG